MKNIINELGLVLGAVLLVLVMVACGGVDGDAPGYINVFEEDSSGLENEVEASSGKGDSIAISAGEDEGDAAVSGEEEGAGEGVREEVRSAENASEEIAVPGDYQDGEAFGHARCARICFKQAWCGEEGNDFVECLNNCEEAEFNGVISEWNMGCLDEAKTCSDVKRCENEIEACFDVCGMYEYCGTYGNIDACQGWCVGEIWGGRLDARARSCAWDAGVHDRCEELASCGFSEPRQ